MKTITIRLETNFTHNVWTRRPEAKRNRDRRCKFVLELAMHPSSRCPWAATVTRAVSPWRHSINPETASGNTPLLASVEPPVWLRREDAQSLLVDPGPAGRTMGNRSSSVAHLALARHCQVVPRRHILFHNSVRPILVVRHESFCKKPHAGLKPDEPSLKQRAARPRVSTSWLLKCFYLGEKRCLERTEENRIDRIESRVCLTSHVQFITTEFVQMILQRIRRNA